MRSLLAIALSMGFGSGAFAANPTAAPARPDVLVLVLGIMGSYDHVSINYSSTMPQQQVQADLASVVNQTHWPISDVRISTESVNTPGAQATTQLVFRVPSVESRTEGTLPLSPFVNALKRYKVIEIDYVLPPEFVFKGRRDFENEYVKVVMRQSGNSYNYSVQVKDPNFNNIQIPLTPDQPGKKMPAPSPIGPRILMILGIAVAGAALVYIVTAYIANRRRV